ncbi:SDR family oxidoreductase [Ancylobacter sp. MQZ15Z-1]|uniref:SDR family oxidoreductase n=1 Tax=Ancylobacter mangrovi TaxID=2972472 RepID=A0A9X2PGU7_9HYPH|nr:SDR family oxidoreductase [Ancylobacter mangrovi]MCS0496801.1 SDR family oxidoreductase [Ancylobacter mangrovi]
MTKTVLITGCSTGFGRAAALHFAQQGWNVVATMRRPEAGADLAADNVLVTRLDVQDRDSIAAALDAGIARFGRIDVVVNNAGYGLFGLFEATPRAKVIEQFEVNLFGVMDVTRAVLPHMRANGGGVIVNVSSGAGVFTLPMISLYCASKFALEGFSESLSFELASQNIRVKLVEPGGVLSTDFGRRSTQEAAGAASIPDYDRFVERTAALFAGLRGERLASEADVVEVIYRAASDDSDRLRYVATEDIRPLVAARREGSEEAYMALLRQRFSGAA